MTPAPPSGQVIVTNDGVITPYVRTEVDEEHAKAEATIAADDNIIYIDVYGLEDLSGASFDYPPRSNIEEISVLENGVLRVTASEPWLPSPFDLDFEIGFNGGFVVDFTIDFV